MKPRSLMLFLLPVAACTGTSAPPSTEPSAAPTTTVVAAVPSPPTMTVEADVVTLDAAGPSVTLRAGDVPPLKAPKASDIKKGDRTIKVEATTVASLSTLKPGDHVSVTCRQVVAATLTAASPGALASPGAMASSAASGLDLCEAIVSIAKAGGSSPAP